MSISSRERVLTTANMRRGKMNLPNRITPIMTREFSPRVIRLSCRDNSNFPLRSGKRSMIGTMTRSWKMRIARQTLPCGESDWAFCWKRLKTMAVEERVTKQPKATAFCHGNTAENIAVISKIVKLICPNPPIKRGRFIRFKSFKESSMPMVKSKRATPTSAIMSTASISDTSFSAEGPQIMPATNNATMLGILNFAQIRMTTMEIMKTAISSCKKSKCIALP